MNDKQLIQIKDLRSSIDGKEILKGVDLAIRPGELHVLMGPNGSGKSTLAQVIAGHPGYVVNGELRMVNGDIKKLTPDKRAKLGIFLGFQQPVEIPGVSVFNMLRRARSSVNTNRVKQRKVRKNARSDIALYNRITKSGTTFSASAFRQELLEYASSLKLSDDFLRRSLNEGFSGGEKKRNEILQMMALRPKLAILDEIDSGLDVDGLRIVAGAIKKFSTLNSGSSILLITHYARILKYLKPDFVHVMIDGRIVKSGRSKLAAEIERSGYEKFQSKIKNLKVKIQNYGSSRQARTIL